MTALLLLLCRHVPHQEFPLTAGFVYFLGILKRRWVSSKLAIVEWAGAVLAFAFPVTMATFGQIPGATMALVGLVVWLWASQRATNRILRADPWYGEP